MSASVPAVLVVDDDPDSGHILTEMLEVEGCRALRAWSVPEALDLLESDTVGYVITDYSMPGRDGLDLLTEMAQHERWRAIPVLMISGHDATGAVARRARSYGARFFPKPIEPAILVAIAKRELGLGEPRAGAARTAAQLAARAAERAGALAGVLRTRTDPRRLLHGAVVLVVESDPSEARRLATALAKVGARARTVATDADALLVLSVEAIDAIVCSRAPAEIDEKMLAATRALPTVHFADRPKGDGTDEGCVSRSAPATVVVERLAALFGRAPTRRLPRVS